MNGSILDTNVITKMLANDPVAINMVKKVGHIYTSVIVVGELYFAADNSSRREANFKIFHETLSCIDIIPIDDTVCISYAEIKLGLKKKGKPIPDNDIWIAACAHARGFSVATFDGHFSEITQIKLVSAD
jgi:tRNA(fMet)-specific endonuclease VapC